MQRCALTFGLVVTLIMFVPAAGTARAQSGEQCFSETGFCVAGRFLQFWQQNGGLGVFGYPIGNALTENSRSVQYFERQRFELHPENQPPYDVLLGLLGEEVLSEQGVDWRTQPVSPAAVAGCQWFAATSHNVCDQQPGNGFLTYWSSNGLEFDGQAGKTYAESLALFGQPITEPYAETLGGESIQVQWFERARFEWHPNNVSEFRVLLGRLGVEIQNHNPPPTPSPSPAPGPAYNDANTPVSLLASLYDAINRQDYTRALGYWETPPATAAEYAQGYANTASVRLLVQPPTFVDAGAGNLRAWVSVVLVATQRDGSLQYFAGCYQNHKVNIEPNTVWQIEQAQIKQVPASSDFAALLAESCSVAYNAPGPNEYAYDVQDSGVDVLASFYNAVSRFEYQRAYGYWQNPPTSYDQFVQGYANTNIVQLIIEPPTTSDIGAGQISVTIPTVLKATNRDLSTSLFAGCYTTRGTDVQPEPWRISGATIAPAAASALIPALFVQGCAP